MFFPAIQCDAGLHFYLYFVNVHPGLPEGFRQSGGQLPDFRSDCAVGGMDDHLSKFHVGHPAMLCQRRRCGAFEYSLQI